MTKNLFLALGLAPLLSACAVTGGSGDKDALNLYPLRPATRDESRALKACLKSVHQLREEYLTKFERPPSRIAELPYDKYCDSDIRVSRVQLEEGGYEIEAQLNEAETSVVWSLNERGVIEEHVDPDQDMDLEF